MLALWTGRYGYIFGTTQRTTYWNLVPTGEVFALAVCYVDNFWETQLLWPIFRTVGASTLNRTLRIFLWNISKNNILEFGAYCWSICFGSVLYICGQLLGNTISLTDFQTVGASTLNRTLRIFLWNISKNNILEFGAYWWSICSGSVLCDNFWETQLLWSTDFRTVGATTLNRMLRIFLWNISKNNIPEFGIYWRNICLGSVLFGQIFVNTISLAVFWIVRASHLVRVQWISFWNIPKNNILEFGAYSYYS